MENGVVVMAGADVGKKVFNGFGRFLGVQFDFDRAEISVQGDSHNNPSDRVEKQLCAFVLTKQIPFFNMHCPVKRKRRQPNHRIGHFSL